MEQHVNGILEFGRRHLSDPETGPCSKNQLNDLIFGGGVVPHGGYWGYEIANHLSFSKQVCNAYNLDGKADSSSLLYDQRWTEEHNRLQEEHVKPLFRGLRDVASAGARCQAEIGRILGVPSNLSGEDGQKDRMIAELIARGKDMGLVRTYKEGGRLMVIPGDVATVPDSDYTFQPSSRMSKYEASVNGLLRGMLPFPKYKIYWNLFKAESRGVLSRSPFDFAIYHEDNNEIPIGLIEVDGEQHEKRIAYFHRNPLSFERREEIDNTKTAAATEIVGSNFLRIKPATLRNSRSLRRVVSDFAESLKWVGRENQARL